MRANAKLEWVVSLRGIAGRQASAAYWMLPTEIHFFLRFPLLLRPVNINRPLRLAFCLVASAIGY